MSPCDKLPDIIPLYTFFREFKSLQLKQTLPYFQKFNKLKKIVEEWYIQKVILIGNDNLFYKKIEKINR